MFRYCGPVSINPPSIVLPGPVEQPTERTIPPVGAAPPPACEPLEVPTVCEQPTEPTSSTAFETPHPRRSARVVKAPDRYRPD